MSDVIAKLNTLKETPTIEFCKAADGAKLPKRCTDNPSLFILFAVQDYTIYAGTLIDGEYNEDADKEILTGIKIKSAHNVELTAFAPVEIDGFEREIFEKQSEIVINPKHKYQLAFKASQLFRVDFSSLRPTVLHIRKGDPICYLKVTSVPQVWVEGIDV